MSRREAHPLDALMHALVDHAGKEYDPTLRGYIQFPKNEVSPPPLAIKTFRVVFLSHARGPGFQGEAVP